MISHIWSRAAATVYLVTCPFTLMAAFPAEAVDAELSASAASSTQLGPGEHDVTLDGIRIHYSVRGSGPVLIAHSGGPGVHPDSWGDFAGLDAVATLVIIHPRGSGKSAPSPSGEYLLAHYAADLEALRAHLGVARPMILGWSHGGMVAQYFASEYPESLSGLILFSTAARLAGFLGDIETSIARFRDEPWFEDAYAALQDEWAGNYETDSEMGQLLARELKFYFKEFDDRAQAYLASIAHLPVSVAPLKVFNENEAMTLDLRERLQKINVHTLIIAGRHDFICTVDMAREMANNTPAVRLEIFEESGHFAIVEEPERFRRVVSEFILAHAGEE